MKQKDLYDSLFHKFPLNKLSGTECSLKSIVDGVNCESIVWEYISPSIKNKSWKWILNHYGCEYPGQACVFQWSINEYSERPDFDYEKFKNSFVYFKYRGEQVIPQNMGTPIAELNQLMSAFEQAYQDVHLYPVPIVSSYSWYATPDICHLETGVVALYKSNQKWFFV